ncbi:unnamed protein product [Spirodela intermedia]|uniref:Uncharacterized protein n=1 Tax=Spirodela intermedia TaxID=51605 RepID=A0A7I8JQA3_SPIIN|nr:unnamed protein product [Spirodela intermedia]CAA6671612.1 unnamed protein product [Spirodela intermedia]
MDNFSFSAADNGRDVGCNIVSLNWSGRLSWIL